MKPILRKTDFANIFANFFAIVGCLKLVAGKEKQKGASKLVTGKEKGPQIWLRKKKRPQIAK